MIGCSAAIYWWKISFLPGPLNHLFPHPPQGKYVDTYFDLNIDNTWGDGKANTINKKPNDASFEFVVIISPEQLQVSPDKRDGSHWELFSGNDAVGEEQQTIQMFYTDTSENGNSVTGFKLWTETPTLVMVPAHSSLKMSE